MEERSPSGCLRRLLISLIIAGILLSLGVGGLRWWLINQIKQNIGAAEYQRLHQFFSTPVTIPPAAQNVPPVPRDLRAALTRFQQGYENNKTAGAQLLGRVYSAAPSVDSITNEQLTSLSLFMQSAHQWVDDTRALVNRPDFDAELLADPPGISSEVYSALNMATRVLGLNAAAAARAGNMKEAFDCGFDELRLAQRGEYSTVLVHLLAIGSANRATSTVADLSLRTNDAGILRDVLKRLRELRPKVDFPSFKMGEVTDMLGSLRLCAREGYPVNLSSGQTAGQLFDQHVKSFVSAPEWLLRNLPSNDWRRSKLIMTAQRNPSAFGYPKPLFTALSYFGVREMMAGFAVPNITNAQQRAQMVGVNLDLTEIVIASRIRKLEKGEDVTSVSQLVPEFLKTEPKDPFANSSYKWSARWKRFYSVGPDGDDDALSIEFGNDRRGTNDGDVTVPSVSVDTEGTTDSRAVI